MTVKSNCEAPKYTIIFIDPPSLSPFAYAKSTSMACRLSTVHAGIEKPQRGIQVWTGREFSEVANTEMA